MNTPSYHGAVSSFCFTITHLRLIEAKYQNFPAASGQRMWCFGTYTDIPTQIHIPDIKCPLLAGSGLRQCFLLLWWWYCGKSELSPSTSSLFTVTATTSLATCVIHSSFFSFFTPGCSDSSRSILRITSPAQGETVLITWRRERKIKRRSMFMLYLFNKVGHSNSCVYWE